MRMISIALIVALALALALTGCGPLMMPMVPRLEPEDQAKIDAGWNRALTPTQRLDRQQLLDVTVVGMLHLHGVDRVTYRAEKMYDKGTVVMEVHFDRGNPNVDRFDISVYDVNWELKRRESYRRKEVDLTCHDLFGPESVPPAVEGEKPPVPTQRELRLLAIQEILQSEPEH